MTAYTLLEQPSRRTLPKRQWQILIFIISALLIILLLASLFVHPQQQQQQHQPPSNQTNHQTTNTTTTKPPPPPSWFTPLNTTDPPVHGIPFYLDNSNQTHYIDLAKYPIEDQLLQLFGGPTVVPALQHILSQQPRSWTEWHDSLNQTDCASTPLPFPLLRQITKDYLPLSDQDGFFEVPLINHSFAILPTPRPSWSPNQIICVRVAVPFQNLGQSDPYRLLYRPYDQNHEQLTSPWWDTMMTSLVETKTNASLPIHLQPWSGHRLLRDRARQLNQADPQLPEWARLRADLQYERDRMHIYEANVVLKPGQWQFQGLLEFVEGRYNFEFGPVTPYSPRLLPVVGGDRLEVVEQGRPVRSARDLWLAQMRLPLCQGMDHPGRWLPLPQNVTEAPGVLRDNTYWAPYTCRYRHISYEAFNRCASQKYSGGIDLYGDSNIRRSIKKFLSHGQWCKGWEKHITSPLLPDELRPVIQTNLTKRTPPFAQADTPPPPPPPPSYLFPPVVEDKGIYASPEEYKFSIDSQTRSCYCEDYREDYWNPTWFDPGARRFDMIFRNSKEQSKSLGKTEWDHKGPLTDQIRVSSYKWDGLTYLNSPSWDTAVPSSSGTASIAIFSLGNWDGAFSQLDAFALDLDRLIDQIKQHYNSRTQIIYRTAQYYCCRVDHSERSRQVSGPRMESFDRLARDRFVTELGAIVWDTAVLGESKRFEEKLMSITCPSNHVPADQVEVENQILMNGLCNA